MSKATHSSIQNSIEYIVQHHDIILFDEICVLCNAWTKFLIQYDRHARFKLASVQSPLGQRILRHYQMPTDHFDTMLVIKNGQAYTESTAFLKVIQDIKFPFKLLTMRYALPKILRDFLYRRVALNRYQLFGTTDQCVLPSRKNQIHFLEYVVHADE